MTQCARFPSNTRLSNLSNRKSSSFSLQPYEILESRRTRHYPFLKLSLVAESLPVERAHRRPLSFRAIVSTDERNYPPIHTLPGRFGRYSLRR